MLSDSTPTISYNSAVPDTKFQARWILTSIYFMCFLWACGFSKTLVFTRNQIQEKLVGKFPIHKEAFRLTATLSDPVVRLDDGSDRIGIDLVMTVAYPAVMLMGKTLIPEGQAVSSVFGVTGKVRYVPGEGQLYFTDPEILRLEIDRLPDAYTDQVKRVGEEVLGIYLSRVPIYSIRDSTLKKKTTKLLLRSVVVKDGQLHVRVGIG